MPISAKIDSIFLGNPFTKITLSFDGLGHVLDCFLDLARHQDVRTYSVRQTGILLAQTVNLLLQIGQEFSGMGAIHLRMVKLEGNGQFIPKAPLSLCS